MKIRSLKQAKGFTLIEILIVITIIALLSSMMWAAVGWIRSKSMKGQAETHIALIEASLEAYKTDNGGVMPYGRGDEWSSHVMYRILSGDYDNDGRQDRDKAGQLVTAYCDTIAINSSPKTETQEGLPAYRVKLAKSPDMPTKIRKSTKPLYAVIDPWGVPYRYCLGCEADCDDEDKKGYGINAHFDVYSLGPDSLGNGKTNQGQNEDNISNIKTWQ